MLIFDVTIVHSVGMWCSDNEKQYHYVCINSNRPDSKSNPNANPPAKQLATVSIQLSTVTCPICIQRNSYETMLLH